MESGQVTPISAKLMLRRECLQLIQYGSTSKRFHSFSHPSIRICESRFYHSPSLSFFYFSGVHLLGHNLVQISYVAATSILQCSAASIRKVAVKKVIEVFVRMTLFLLVQNQCSEEEQEKYKPRLWSILNAHLSIEPNEYASLNDNSRDHYDWSYYNG